MIILERVRNTDSKWSVIEGDEYHNIKLANGAKFLEYKPDYVIITNIGYEHFDIFPTKENYIEEFGKLKNVISKKGFFIVKNNDENIEKALEGSQNKIIRYGKKGEVSDYQYETSITKEGLSSFKLFKDNELKIEGETKLMGTYNIENMLAAYALLDNLSLIGKLETQEDELISFLKENLPKFNGIEKRLQILNSTENFIVIDDYGVAPSRAINSINTLREYYPEFKVTAIFEPNSGSRTKDKKLFMDSYKGVFSNVDEVIIPTLSTAKDEFAGVDEFMSWFNELGFNSIHIASEDILNYLQNKFKDKKEKPLIVFFSANRLTQVAHDFSNWI
ncbi:MAG: Mur ligase family protein [Candidatus Dojkabacteria bacterium]|nr:Mur ligase family protein [Candidatus Dojkabacteria bacterium]